MKGGKTGRDVVVIGAGSSGAAAAWLLAEQGLRVTLLERRSRRQAGGHWVNDVADWMFRRAGVPEPEAEERVGAHHPFHFLAKQGGGRVLLKRRPSLCVDMRALVKRLQDAALEAGAVLMDRARAIRMESRGGRPTAVQVERRTTRGRVRKEWIEADLFVDASGLAGAWRQLDPACADAWPRPAEKDLCAASQVTFEVRDRAGARSFMERYGAPQGGNLAWAGVRGGFSTRMVTIHGDLDRVELLTGAVATHGYASGDAIIRDFVADQKWVGKRIFGGAGLIPLRRPYHRLVRPGVALLGDAGCQVFPLHGSGVGNGMVAARMLADAVATGGDPGALEVTWKYQNAFQREIGAVNAANDVLRRFSQDLTEGQVDELTNSGLVGASSLEAGLGQRLYVPDAVDLMKLVPGVFRTPGLSARFSYRFPLMMAAWGLYRQHPDTPGGPAFSAWCAASDALFGEWSGARESDNLH